jgi:hypothetical protein
MDTEIYLLLYPLYCVVGYREKIVLGRDRFPRVEKFSDRL